MSRRHIEELRQRLQIAFHAGHRSRPASLPTLLPLPKGPSRLTLVCRPVHRRRFGHATPLPPPHFVGDVAQLVRPAQLHRHAGKQQWKRRAQPRPSMAVDQLQTPPFQAAQIQILQKLCPGRLALSVQGEPVSQHFSPPLRAMTICSS